MAPQLRRALARDEDAEVRKWSSLALARLGPAEGDGGAGTGAAMPESRPEGLLRDPNASIRYAAALTLAESGDARGEGELVARAESTLVPGSREPGELDDARELLAALAKLRARSATPVLVRSLEDVRLRPFLVEALAEIGDARAVAPLLATFAVERYVDVRPKEARALQKLGAREALLAPLRLFAGVPDPMMEAVEVARDVGLLVPAQGGWKATSATEWHVDAEVTVPGRGPARLLVLGAGPAGGPLTARVDGAATPLKQQGAVWTAELVSVGPKARIEASSTTGVAAFWVVRRAEEIPPPAPHEWRADGGL